MMCQQCQQRPASVHVTQIMNNEKREVHLCEQCARENEQLSINSPFVFSSPFNFNNLLAGFLGKDFAYQVKPQEKDVSSEPVCDVCGMTSKQFLRNGKLGCANCYTAFQEILNPAIRRIHGSTTHTGKFPKRTGGMVKVRREMEQLKIQLNEAVRLEEYEKAAQLRDHIRELEDKLKGEE